MPGAPGSQKCSWSTSYKPECQGGVSDTLEREADSCGGVGGGPAGKLPSRRVCSGPSRCLPTADLCPLLIRAPPGPWQVPLHTLPICSQESPPRLRAAACNTLACPPPHPDPAGLGGSLAMGLRAPQVTVLCSGAGNRGRQVHHVFLGSKVYLDRCNSKGYPCLALTLDSSVTFQT